MWGNYGKQTKLRRERRYRIDEITYAKGGGTVNAYMCAEGEVYEGSKIDHNIRTD